MDHKQPLTPAAQEQRQQQEKVQVKPKGSFDLGSDSADHGWSDQQQYDRSASAPASNIGSAAVPRTNGDGVTIRAPHLTRWRKMLLSNSKAVRQEGAIGERITSNHFRSPHLPVCVFLVSFKARLVCRTMAKDGP